MKVRAKQTHAVNVELDEWTVEYITVNELMRLIGRVALNVPFHPEINCFIRDGYLVEIEEARNGNIEHNEIRKATELEIQIIYTVNTYLNSKKK